jgi:hemerythrin-like domain-containing protein
MESVMTVSKIQFSFPGHRSPSVGYEAPFEMLEACHERVQRSLSLLERVRHHASKHGCDQQTHNALNDIIRYFDKAAPQHHLDEERHVFPAILHQNNTDLNQIINRLKTEHHQMECLWVKIRHIFNTVMSESRKIPVFTENENLILDTFSNLYQKHIIDEEKMIYPTALNIINNNELLNMSNEMMQRRGLHKIK